VSDDAPRLALSLDGFEGPLDVLLDLARRQKVDLRRISITALVDQYLAFVEEARARALTVAADHLVMAAWLTLLKSALLLPSDPAEDPAPEDVAARLAHRLARLQAMRDAAAALDARPRLGRDVHARGAPEGLRRVRSGPVDADLADLVAAYGAVLARARPATYAPKRPAAVTIEQALARLQAWLGAAPGWASLDLLAARLAADPALARSARASALVAALELARQGRLELAQDAPFGPVRVRAP
jgi:segregation and condensation protein A